MGGAEDGKSWQRAGGRPPAGRRSGRAIRAAATIQRPAMMRSRSRGASEKTSPDRWMCRSARGQCRVWRRRRPARRMLARADDVSCEVLNRW